MTVMLENNVIPIVNENDTISVSELMFTDNDELSGLIASMMDTQALIILSNIDGITMVLLPILTLLLSGRSVTAKTYPTIFRQLSPASDGGMLTKTNIARKVADEGITVIIANGKRNNIFVDLLQHPEETLCTALYLLANRYPVSRNGLPIAKALPKEKFTSTNVPLRYSVRRKQSVFSR